ncbi:MAG: hypothetical protein ACOYUZ_04215 [Patescibacteria group bacterium]
MASEAAKQIIAAKLAAAKPFKPEQAKALDAFYKAARDYQEKILAPAQRLPSYGERRDFLNSDSVKQWDAHIKEHLELLQNLGIKFSGLMIADICRAFIAVYLSVKTS